MASGAKAIADEGDKQAVPITSLGVQELSRLREQLQGDVEHLVDSHALLGRLAARSEAAAKAINNLSASKTDQPLLLPLTNSLYVRGRVADSEKLLVNVGTDYFVEMSAQQAADYCKRKAAYTQKQQAGVQKVAQERRKQLMQVTGVLRDKVAAGQAAAAAGGGK